MRAATGDLSSFQRHFRKTAFHCRSVRQGGGKKAKKRGRNGEGGRGARERGGRGGRKARVIADNAGLPLPRPPSFGQKVICQLIHAYRAWLFAMNTHGGGGEKARWPFNAVALRWREEGKMIGGCWGGAVERAKNRTNRSGSVESFLEEHGHYNGMLWPDPIHRFNHRTGRDGSWSCPVSLLRSSAVDSPRIFSSAPHKALSKLASTAIRVSPAPVPSPLPPPYSLT